MPTAEAYTLTDESCLCADRGGWQDIRLVGKLLLVQGDRRCTVYRWNPKYGRAELVESFEHEKAKFPLPPAPDPKARFLPEALRKTARSSGDYVFVTDIDRTSVRSFGPVGGRMKPIGEKFYVYGLSSVAVDGGKAGTMFKSFEPDVVLLDIMLPVKDGWQVCREIREKSSVPIIMLTAKGETFDKVLCLELGADDYITKPFNILEVKARMKAIMRRSVLQESALESAKQLVYEGFLLDCESRRLFIDDKEVRLTTKEYEVLELLASHPNKIYSRDNLMNIIWGYEFVGDLRTVDVHVRRLREKMEKDPGEPTYIQTKWGSGYYFNDNDDSWRNDGYYQLYYSC